MNHLLIGHQCLFCQKPKAVANYMSFDAQTGNAGDIHSFDLLENTHRTCPGGWFFAFKVAIIGASALLFLVQGPELWVICLVAVFLLSYFARTNDPRPWFGIEEVKSEYEKLSETLKSVGRLYYLQHIERVIRPLAEAREKAFHIIPILAEESTLSLNCRLQQLEESAMNATNPDLKITFQSQAGNLRENIDKLKKMAVFMEKFEANKRSIVSSLKLLRTKIILAETTGDDGEVKKILNDLQSLHSVYDRVNEDLSS